MARWAALFLAYPFYRPFTNLPRTRGRRLIVVIGRVVLMAGVLGIVYRLGQHALLTVALDHHQRSDPPLPPIGYFPLAHPLTAWQIVALFGGLLLLLALDRQTLAWPIHLTWQWPFIEIGRSAPRLRLPSVQAELLALGRPYRRLWNEMANQMDETLLPNEVYTASVAELCTHVTIVAPTRAGKTYNITIPLIEFTDRLEGAGIFIDAKGDDLTGPKFDGMYPGAFHRRFNLRDFEHSFRLQLWVGQTIEERAERLAACLVPEGTTDESRYFSNSARGAFINLTLAHYTVYRQEPTLPQLLKYLRNADSRATLSQQLPKDSDLKEAVARITELRSGKTDVLGGLDGILDPLAKPNIARFFAGPGEGHTIEELLQAQARVCFTLPTGPMPVAKILGRLVISQFTQVVLDAENNTEYLKLLVIEDATNFVTPMLGTAMAQASSHMAAYVLIFQDLAQVRDEALIQDILTNSGLKIVLGGIGDADSARFSKLFGSRERLFRTQTASSGRGQGRSQSSGHSHNSGSSQRGDNQSQQHHVGWGLAPRTRPDFTATDLRYLPDHHAVIERRDNQGHLTPATLIHFDADLVRTLTLHQRQDLLGPEAEPLNHLQPIFAPRPVDDSAARDSESEIAGDAGTAREVPSGGTPVSGAPSTAPASQKVAATAPTATTASDLSERPALATTPAIDAPAEASTPDSSPAADRPAAPTSERSTTPLLALPEARTQLAAASISSGSSPSPDGVPTDTPSIPVNLSAPQDGGPLAQPVPPGTPTDPVSRPIAEADKPEPVSPMPIWVPEEPGGSILTEPGGADRPFDPAVAAQLLVKQLDVDGPSANFAATAAARKGYTTATFAALLAQVLTLPASVNRYSVLFAQVTGDLPLPNEESEPADDFSIA
jgi:hypothetical protein